MHSFGFACVYLRTYVRYQIYIYIYIYITVYVIFGSQLPDVKTRYIERNTSKSPAFFGFGLAAFSGFKELEEDSIPLSTGA